ncbi:MAG: hypothetical protein LUD50_04040 [Clostridia bacterium]|nr:hypothetical protein [Clostridia bacterium]
MIKNKIVFGVVTACVAASMALMTIGLAACSECDHDWDEGTVTTDGTCQTPGIMTYTCNKCGATKTEYYLADHTYDYDNGTIIDEASCGVEGKIKYTCTVCGDYIYETIDATGEHVWDADDTSSDGWETILEPETYAEGLRSRTCTVCGTVEEQAIAALGEGNYNSNHDYSEAVYYSDAVEGSDVITQAGWYITCNHYGCDYVKALADEDVAYLVEDASQLKSVITNASTDTKIKLNNDIELDSALSIAASSEVTIDLNGCAITTTLDSSSNSINKTFITVSGTLNLTDSSRKGNGSISHDENSGDRPIEVVSGGTLNVDGGTYSGMEAVIVRAGATVTINSGTFIGVEGSGSATIQTQGTTTINGGTITSASCFAVNDLAGETTIKGGTLTADNSAAVNVASGATLTVGTEDGDNNDISILSKTSNGIQVMVGATAIINSGTIKSTGTDSTAVGIFNDSGTTAASLTVNGGKISGTYYGVSTEGTIKDNLATVTVNGGSVTGSHTGMYLAGNGTYTVSDGTIRGAVGVEIRAGSLTISGGTISGSTRTFTLANDGAGNEEGPAVDSGAALAVVQHKTALAITVNVTGGSLTGYYAAYEANLQGNDASAIEKISITIGEDITIKGDIYLEDFIEEEEPEDEDTEEDETQGDDSETGDSTTTDETTGNENNTGDTETNEPSDSTGDGTETDETNGAEDNTEDTESSDTTGSDEGGSGDGDDNGDNTETD